MCCDWSNWDIDFYGFSIDCDFDAIGWLVGSLVSGFLTLTAIGSNIDGLSLWKNIPIIWKAAVIHLN